MKLSILGDSFSSDTQQGSWINNLSQKYQIINISYRGISQYRILENFQKNLDLLSKQDAIILWHTDPSRVYVNDLVSFPTRMLESHLYADLLINDSLASDDPNWVRIAKNYYKNFYNHSQQEFLHQSIKKEIRVLSKGTKLIECTGFDTDDNLVKSFNFLLSECPGKINHFNVVGNRIVSDYIEKFLL